MGKIYIVSGDFSSWDTHHKRNLKAFSEREKAEEYVEKANRVLSAFSHHLAEVDRLNDEKLKLFLEMSKNMSEEESDKAYEEFEETPEYKLANEIYHLHWNLQEFNECIISELELI